MVRRRYILFFLILNLSLISAYTHLDCIDDAPCDSPGENLFCYTYTTGPSISVCNCDNYSSTKHGYNIGEDVDEDGYYIPLSLPLETYPWIYGGLYDCPYEEDLDCNDANASISPNATEGTTQTCGDGVDNNCNNNTDCADGGCGVSPPSVSFPLNWTFTNPLIQLLINFSAASNLSIDTYWFNNESTNIIYTAPNYINLSGIKNYTFNFYANNTAGCFNSTSSYFGVINCTDYDGDGYGVYNGTDCSSDGFDCDDTNSSIYPGVSFDCGSCLSTGVLSYSTSVCRASSGDCDSEETCSGSSFYCPADVMASDGTSCTYSGCTSSCLSGVCQVATCGGGGGGGSSVCKDTCFSLGYECGQQLVCSKLFNCGNCLDNKICILGKCVFNCIENWKCSEWSECVNNKETRVCSDLNNCGTILDKPVEIQECNLSKDKNDLDLIFSQLSLLDSGFYNFHYLSPIFSGECDSEWKCSEWSECEVKPVLEDLTSNIKEIKGKQYQICYDLNNCLIPKKESKECSIKVNVRIKELNISNKTYIEVYNEETGDLVSVINNQKLSNNPSLDISFITGNAVYSGSCSNKIKDITEEEIDCGGSCISCDEFGLSFSLDLEDKVDWVFVVNIFLSFLVFLLIIILILINHTNNKIDLLILEGRRYLKNKDMENAKRIYLLLKETYNSSYLGNKQIYKKISDFYHELVNP